MSQGHLSWDDVWAYIDDEEAARAQWVEAHIKECAECERMLQRALQTHHSIQTTFTAMVPSSNEQRVSDLMAKVQAAAPVRGPLNPVSGAKRRNRRRWMWLSTMGSMAAAFVIGVVVTRHANQPSSWTVEQSAQSTSTASSVAKSTSSSNGPMISAQDLQSAPNTTSSPTEDATSAAGSAQQKLGVAAVQEPVLTADFNVHVVDETGRAVANAQVAFVVNGQIEFHSSTAEDGSVGPVKLSVAQDEVLSIAYNRGLSPQGAFTLVAWKDGYQPLVYYGVGVTNNSTQKLDVTMIPGGNGTKAVVSGNGAKAQYTFETLRNYLTAIDSQSLDYTSNHAVATDSQATMTRIHVTDEHGTDLAGAKVTIIANSNVSGTGITLANGNVQIPSAGTADWRTNIGALGSGPRQNVATIVVERDGYTAWIGFLQPLNDTGFIQVKLQSQAVTGLSVQGTAEPPTGDEVNDIYQWVRNRIQSP